MAKTLADAILSVAAEADLPPDNTVTSRGRLAFAADSKKLFYDDGEFWIDLALNGNIINMRISSLLGPNAAFDFNAQRLANLADPTADQDATTRLYVLGVIGAVQTGLQGAIDAKADSSAVATAIASAVAPLATTEYVDDAVAGVGGGGGNLAPFEVAFTREGFVATTHDGFTATVRK